MGLHEACLLLLAATLKAAWALSTIDAGVQVALSGGMQLHTC